MLVPGCGLSRLLFEVVERGYGGQGNEFSYQMLLVSNYMLNHVFEPESVFASNKQITHRSKSILGPIIRTTYSQKAIIIGVFAFQMWFLAELLRKEATSRCVLESFWRVMKSKRMNGIVF